MCVYVSRADMAHVRKGKTYSGACGKREMGFGSGVYATARGMNGLFFESTMREYVFRDFSRFAKARGGGGDGGARRDEKVTTFRCDVEMFSVYIFGI